ncbi:MAG: NADH-quinone oxidoreductase subunit C [Sandaracinaceae bacterium]|nr:NADH-quinone oxidoreductase subunit C [Sandaracinaceae bacterium]
MSKSAIARLKAQFGDKILSTSDFRGDDSCYVAPSDWLAVATFLRDDDQLKMNMFTDLTAVDYPEREPDEPRFELVLMVRSLEKNHRASW